MRLTTVILLATFLHVSAGTFAQKITYKQKNSTIEQLFTEITRQTGYNVFYSDAKIDQNRKLNANFNDTPLEEVLKQTFKGMPVSYKIDDKNIIISKKTSTFLERLANRWAAIDVHGRVVDSENRPLPGASIKVKSTGKAVSTNAKGEFYLEKVDEGAVLVISFIGYVSKEVNAKKEMGDVVLELSDSKLDEVQVIAYGTTSQRLSTGNVSTVKAADIAKQPVNNPQLALAGRVPGLVVSQANGLPGGGVSVQIQGQNSIQNGNDPFYVIDGVPFTSQLLPNLGDVLGSSVGANYGNPFSFINPADIESIDVLKDADATAIYGSRAANGAILITTKKGRAGETKVDANLQTGFGKVTRMAKLLNTQQYLEMRKEAYSNDNVAIPTEPTPGAYDLTFWDQNRNTDWQKELIGNTAHYNDAQLTLSGGSPTVQYLVGAGYHKETTVFPTDLGNQKGSLHFNLNSTSGNQKFRFTLSGNYLLDNNRIPSIDLTSMAMKLAPNAPALLNPDGSVNWAPTSTASYTIYPHPLADLNKLYKNRTSNLIGNALLSYELVPGLNVKSTFGYTSLQTNDLKTNPSTTVPPSFRAAFPRSAEYGNNSINSWIIEPQVTFSRAVAGGHLEVLVGTTIQQSNSERQLLRGTGYNSDLVLENINAASTIISPSNTSIASVYKYNALFGRINYNWKDRYLVNITARRDGTSRFGAENRFHNFGAIGAGWIFTNESFLKNNPSFMSFGKLKASYGTTGSDQIPDYAYLSLYDDNNPPVPYSGGNALTPRNLPNPYLQWEEVRKLSVGLDLGFWNDRILMNANYFQNRSSNQLLAYTLPPSVGFENIQSNFPAKVQNTGFEFALSTTQLKLSSFSWTSNINFTIPKNKLLSFDNLSSSTYYSNRYKIGSPITIANVYHYLGVNPATGKYEFLDANGNPTYNPSNSTNNRNVMINTAQTFYGGLNNSFSYKRFNLDFLFQFVKQKGVTNQYGDGYTGFTATNEPVSVLDRWRKPGDETTIQRSFSTKFDYFFPIIYLLQSDAVYGDASYIRLKNASLSWQFPEEFTKKIHLQNARLYLQGQNLLTITHYKGIDPETRSSLSLPPLRVITLGAQITF
jgi:TonB-linked SusC/RagA family outer membrane protein